jgi:hypothetical protein
MLGLQAGHSEKVRNAIAADILQGMDGMRAAVLHDEARPSPVPAKRRNRALA